MPYTVDFDTVRMAYVFYESGLSINVMYTIGDPKKRAVGFKLSEGMEVPSELASRFKFARQKSSWPEPCADPSSTSRTSTDAYRSARATGARPVWVANSA